jgi:SAM-dependent methyltransferase
MPILDYGRTALANRFLRESQLAEPEPTFPLRLCLCQSCGLVQIDETVDPDVLFQDYVYVTGTSDLAVKHANGLARRITERYQLGPRDLVLEAASNDGTVLKAFAKNGVRAIGIEPAANIAARALADGSETIAAYFGVDTAEMVRDRAGPAKVFLARHVLAHVPDLHGFLRSAARCLTDDGVAMVEVPHLLPFYENLEFDTVYHEHLCYFSVRVLQTLGTLCGLEIIDAENVSIHGGSVLVTFQPAGGPRFPTAAVERMLDREVEAGLDRPEPWAAFARQASDSREQLMGELGWLNDRGFRVAGYGAAAKGMCLLSFHGIGSDLMPYVVDKSPHKQGLYTPGHHLPVKHPDVLLEDRPDVVTILAWNFANEIVEQQAEYRRRGGTFLLPLPVPRFIEGPVVKPVRKAA